MVDNLYFQEGKTRMLTFLKKQLKNDLITNVLILLTGSVISQLINVIISPLLSRIYNPEDFGIYTIYSSIVGIFSVIICLKYELAIVLPKKSEDAINLVYLSKFVTLILTIIVMFSFVFLKDTFLNLLDIEENYVLWFIPISLVFTGIYNSLNYWSTRQKLFKRISNSTIIRSNSVAATQLIGGFLKVGSIGLVLGQIIGNIVASVVLAFQVWKDDKHLFKRAFNLNRIKELSKEYSDFPKYSAPQAFINQFTQSSVPLILNYFFSPTLVGFYSLALRILQLPVYLLGEAVRKALFPRMAEFFNSGKSLKGILVKSTYLLCLIMIIPTLILIFWGPNLFSIIFGSKWYYAGEVSRWLGLWIYFVFITRPTIVAIQIVNLQKFFFYYETLGFFIKIGLFILIIAVSNSFLLSIIVYSISNAFSYVILFFYVLFKVSDKGKNLVE